MATNNLVDNCIEGDIMQNLKSGFSRCTFSDGRLRPCNYHENRSGSLIFTTNDMGGCKPIKLSADKVYMSKLVKSPHIVDMLQKLSSGINLAGSWWMIKEQREWLHRHLVDIFTEKSGESCHLLVSGVAGYAHFYSYLRVIFDAAQEAAFNIENIYVDVVDACITPILEIANIEQSIRKIGGLTEFICLKKEYDILGFKFGISVDNKRFIKTMIPNIRKCHIRALHCDILHIGDYRMEMLNRYDVITEHFLLSMIENERHLIDNIRKSYASMLREGGHLLMAGGFSNSDFIRELIEIHSRHNLVMEGDDNVAVWDPYGLSASVIQDIINKNTTTHTLTLDNCLIDFTKKQH